MPEISTVNQWTSSIQHCQKVQSTKKYFNSTCNNINWMSFYFITQCRNGIFV